MKKPVFLDAQFHTLSGSGGVGKYIHELSRSIRQAVGQVEFPISVCNEPPIPAAVVPPSRKQIARQKLKEIVKGFAPPVVFEVAKRSLRSPSGSLPQPAQIARPSQFPATPFILHETTNHSMHPELGRLALNADFRLCATFHDIQDYFYPEYFSDQSLLHRRLCYSMYKERADLFFAISEFTKQTMVEKLDIPAQKILVTHLAGDEWEATLASSEVSALLASLGRFVIYPAKSWPHKNHENLLIAFSKAREAMKKSGISLVLTGGFTQSEKDGLLARCADLKISDQVRILGFLEDDTLKHVVKNAVALVFPSLFEGFGMPVLEAMQLGTPVVCSSAGSLPEITGDAALRFDPHRVDELVGHLESIAAGSFPVALLRERGLVQARKFSWQNTYESTLKGYRRLQ